MKTKNTDKLRGWLGSRDRLTLGRHGSGRWCGSGGPLVSSRRGLVVGRVLGGQCCFRGWYPPAARSPLLPRFAGTPVTPTRTNVRMKLMRMERARCS